MPIETPSGTIQFLTFHLDKETYAFDIQKVKEVIDVTKITKVPRMPDYLLGAINLRGSVVPVIQLCGKFGLPAGEKTVDTCIIIVETDLSGETITLGVMVDSIKEVLTLEKSMIDPPPRIGMRINTGYIKGIGKKGNDFIILLDINRLMSEEATLKNAETVTEG